MTDTSCKYDIRAVAPDQVKALKEIAEKTFLESFAHLNTVENIKLYRQKAFSEEAIKTRIRHNKLVLFLCP